MRSQALVQRLHKSQTSARLEDHRQRIDTFLDDLQGLVHDTEGTASLPARRPALTNGRAQIRERTARGCNWSTTQLL